MCFLHNKPRHQILGRGRAADHCGSVTLYAQVPPRDDLTTPSVDPQHDRTQILLRTFEDNPRFIPYVRELDYRFSANYFGQPSAFIEGIRQFPNIENLLVGFYYSRLGHNGLASYLDTKTLSAVFDIMKRPSFRKLTLHSVLAFPMEFIRGAPTMRELVLRGICSSVMGDGGVPLPAP